MSLAHNFYETLPQSTVHPRWKIAIVRSSWHSELTDALNIDARNALLERGMKEEKIIEIATPGSFETPLFCQVAIEREKVDGVIALGVVLRGETHHAELIAREAARGIMDVQLRTGVPIVFEILYCDSLDVARERTTGASAKGRSAVETLLTSLAKLHELQS